MHVWFLWFLHTRILLNCLAFVEMQACILVFNYSLWRSSVAPLLVHHVITGGHHNTSQFFPGSNLLSPVVIMLLWGNCSYIYMRVYRQSNYSTTKSNLVQKQAFLPFLCFFHYCTFRISPVKILYSDLSKALMIFRKNKMKLKLFLVTTAKVLLWAYFNVLFHFILIYHVRNHCSFFVFPTCAHSIMQVWCPKDSGHFLVLVYICSLVFQLSMKFYSYRFIFRGRLFEGWITLPIG